MTATLPQADHACDRTEPAPRWVTWRQITATPMSRARTGIFVGLLTLTALSWTFVVRSGRGMNAHHGPTPTMGMNAALFLAVWVAMMIATMFPAVAPMVLMFARIGANKRTSGRAYVATWLFVSGYLLVWTALGVVAYVLALGAEAVAAHVEVVSDNAARIGGALIIGAGAYQFSRLKDRCLTQCRSPLAFVMQHWRDGRAGAVRMGVHHGWHCAGCCWALMAVLFPLGMMNIAALAAVTALVFAEKVLPNPGRLAHAAGVVLIAFGSAVLIDPTLLPGTIAHHSM